MNGKRIPHWIPVNNVQDVPLKGSPMDDETERLLTVVACADCPEVGSDQPPPHNVYQITDVPERPMHCDHCGRRMDFIRIIRSDRDPADALLSWVRRNVGDRYIISTNGSPR